MVFKDYILFCFVDCIILKLSVILLEEVVILCNVNVHEETYFIKKYCKVKPK